MKTLVFNGSPKINGDTEALIHEFTAHLHSEIKIISSRNNIKPCCDCRYCWQNIGCAIDDEMQDIYPFIEVCDNIVFASPIWFSSLSGPLLNMTSRIQTVWAAGYFQKKTIPIKEKNGVLIIVGGQPETKDIPTQTAISIMKYFNVRRPIAAKIYSLDTNNLPAHQDAVALEKCRDVAHMLNQASELM